MDNQDQQARADHETASASGRELAEQLVRDAERPTADGYEVQALKDSFTRRAAQAVMVGEPTIRMPGEREEPPSPHGYDKLSEIGQFARSVNRTESLNENDLAQVPFSDVFNDETTLAELVKRVERQRREGR